MSTVAVFIALGGTSYAAMTITGRNVENGSLTGADIKDRSLRANDLALGPFLSGRTGKTGPQGEKGDSVKGPKGDIGAPGLQGEPGPAGPASLARVYFTGPAPAIGLPADQQYHELVSLSIPSSDDGEYLVQAAGRTLTASYATANFGHCLIRTPDGDGPTFRTDNPKADATSGGFGTGTYVVLQGTVRVSPKGPSPVRISVVCRSELAHASSSSFTMSATKANVVTQ